MNAPPAEKIRALLVDDEEPGRINLRYALAAYPTWQLVGECASVAEARVRMAAHVVDVVFLDIRMPRESGLELARELAALDEPPLVIFVTAHNAHAVDAFELHALDYLLKPVDDKRLSQALERAAQMLALRQRGPYGKALRAWLDSREGQQPQYWQQLAVRSVGQIECVRLQDVLWISSAGNYVELHTAARVILHRLPLSKLVDHLDPQEFVRVHRGSIARRDQCLGLNVVGDGSYALSLRCGARLAVSERYIQTLRALMQ